MNFGLSFSRMAAYSSGGISNCALFGSCGAKASRVRTLKRGQIVEYALILVLIAIEIVLSLMRHYHGDKAVRDVLSEAVPIDAFIAAGAVASSEVNRVDIDVNDVNDNI